MDRESIQVLISLPLLLLGFGYMIPLAALLLPPAERKPVPVLLVGAGMSVGFLTLLLWYVGSRLKPGFQAPLIVVVLLGCLLLGTVLVHRERRLVPVDSAAALLAGFLRWPGQVRRLSPAEVAVAVAIVAIAASLALAAVDAVYYPFLTSDSLLLYGSWARAIYRFGGLERFGVPGLGGEYNLYPLFLPLSYAYVYMVAGGVNEQLAKLVPVILAGLNVGATYYAGSVLLSRRVGLVAATLVALTPFHAYWSSSGQTDVPATFFFTMAWVLFYRSLARAGDRRLAIASGIMAGLGLWTRAGNAAVVVPLGILAAGWALSGRRKGELLALRPIGALLLAFAAALAMAGPWYARNHLLAGRVLADTAWTSDADRSWGNLLPFVAASHDFGYLLSTAYAVGLLYALWRLASPLRAAEGAERSSHLDVRALVLAAVTVPYLVLWWYSYSYDVRFLVMILPALAVQAAWALDDLFLRQMRSAPQAALAVAVLAVVAVPALQATSGVRAIENLVLRPEMDEDARQLDHHGAMYAAYLRTRDLLYQEPGARVLTTFLMWSAYGDGHFAGGLPRKLSELEGFQYLVISPWTKDYYRRDGAPDNEVLRSLSDERLFRRVFEQDGFVVYRVQEGG